MAAGPLVETPFRWLLLCMLASIIGTLARSLALLVRGNTRTADHRVVTALTARLLLSFLLFALLMAGRLFDLI